jgi:predicted enzyme related to lactoylglutathione lyase
MEDVRLFDFKPDVNLSAGIEKVPADVGTTLKGRGSTCVYFLVEDVERIVEIIENAGGKVISTVQKEGTNGLFRYFEDTEGIVNVVYQYVGPLA